jgi:hypothetical protein
MNETPWPVRALARQKALEIREVRQEDRSMTEGGRTVHLDRLLLHDGRWIRYGVGRRILYWRRE